MGATDRDYGRSHRRQCAAGGTKIILPRRTLQMTQQGQAAIDAAQPIKAHQALGEIVISSTRVRNPFALSAGPGRPDVVVLPTSGRPTIHTG